jgi:serine/threonine-protein kinase
MAQGVAYLAPGTRLGRYELRRMLAVGGMAELHLARATGIEGFQKLVVLKRILPHLAADPEFIKLFLAEARLAATLHHPNVVEVFDIGSHEGSYFFTMEYVRGQDLGTVISAARKRGEGLLLENALAIVIGMAEGLHHAHEMRDPSGKPLGIVHRDVSPSNVLITYAGGVKVCDFGIAKAVAAQMRTADGSTKGKASYMSPEQCRSEALDRRSDVFSIGIMLYELTTGKRLFRGANELEAMKQICERDVPRPTSTDADYPLALEEIVMKALERDPDKRFASAQELQLALESFARDEKLLISSALLAKWMQELFPDAATAERDDATPVPGSIREPAAALSGELASTPAKRRRSPLVVGGIAGGIAAVVLVAGGGYWLSRSRAAAPAAPVERAAPPAPATTSVPPPAAVPPPAIAAPAPAAAAPVATPPQSQPAAAPKPRPTRRAKPAVAKPTPASPPLPGDDRPPLQ